VNWSLRLTGGNSSWRMVPAALMIGCRRDFLSVLSQHGNWFQWRDDFPTFLSFPHGLQLVIFHWTRLRYFPDGYC
jgi:hypothetical protein